jgi:hypothetical protein
MKFKILAFSILVILGCVSPLNAAIDAVKRLPPMVLKGGSEAQIVSFNSSNTTTDLYNRYVFLARAADGGGDIEAAVKRLRENHQADLKFWKESAAKEFMEPKKPKNNGKGKQAKQAFAQVMKAYERRLEAATERYQNQQAIANAYVTWLSDGVGPWIETLKK